MEQNSPTTTEFFWRIPSESSPSLFFCVSSIYHQAIVFSSPDSIPSFVRALRLQCVLFYLMYVVLLLFTNGLEGIVFIHLVSYECTVYISATSSVFFALFLVFAYFDMKRVYRFLLLRERERLVCRPVAPPPPTSLD